MDANTADAAKYKAEWEKAHIRASIPGTATESVNPEADWALLAPGTAVAEDGTVTIGGLFPVRAGMN